MLAACCPCHNNHFGIHEAACSRAVKAETLLAAAARVYRFWRVVFS